MLLMDFIFRWLHVLFGITWIGLLYYFNFIQGNYFKNATPEGLQDVKEKLVPRALGWFRWSAMLTFITGVLLLVGVKMSYGFFNAYIVAGATLGTIMLLNVWLIIWPNQKVVIGMVAGDTPAAAAKALLASRTNTLFSGPLVLFMLAGPHFVTGGGYGLAAATSTGLWIVLAIIAALEVNAIVGKQGPLASVAGVVHCSLVLAIIMAGLVMYV